MLPSTVRVKRLRVLEIQQSAYRYSCIPLMLLVNRAGQILNPIILPMVTGMKFLTVIVVKIKKIRS